jgi:hypothetical protein
MIRRSISCGSLLMILSLGIPCSTAQVSQQARMSQDTWYEFLVKQFNRSNFDYGSWIENRRRAFLEATAKTPHFWYSASATAGVLLLMLAYAKLYRDHQHSMRITAEMMADLYNHDRYSQQVAREAIETYNRHIEQCNREIEGTDAGEGRPGWGATRVEGLKSELQRVSAQLETTTRDRYRLQEELQQKSAVVAELSMRLDALSKKLNGPEIRSSATGESVTTDGNGGGPRFVGHINRLQEELYVERQKNKRLKGG